MSHSVPEKIDWEDKYRRLRVDHDALKLLTNEQEDHIRRYESIIATLTFVHLYIHHSSLFSLQSKTRKLESDLITLERQKNGGNIL